MKTRPIAGALRVSLPLPLPLVIAVALALAPAANGGDAFAQSSTDDATTKAARSRFQEGVAFYDKGQYENARASFLQAYALRKHPAVLLNLAQSSLRSNHTLDAARFFQQYLREAQGITSAQRDAANSGLAEARTRLGRIDVSAPEGTELSVDSERAGLAPLPDSIDVEPGAHMVRARLPDGREETQSVSVMAGQRSAARFVSAASPPVAPPVAATPPAQPEPEPPPPPETPAAPPPADTDTGGGGSRQLTTTMPIWVGIGLALAGAGTATGFAIAKGSAQDNADGVERAIKAKGGGAGTCAASDEATVAKFGRACATLADNRDAVSTDATIANIGIGVAAVGAVTAVGWLLFGPREASPTSGALRRLMPVPVVARDTTGVSFAGSF